VQGIGIGLSVVRQIVEAHSGAVEITSAPGEGTALAVTMPRHPAVALRPTPAHALQR
jgi:signal transduction histidine kinase